MKQPTPRINDVYIDLDVEDMFLQHSPVIIGEALEQSLSANHMAPGGATPLFPLETY